MWKASNSTESILQKLRHADDAVLVADKRKKMQIMIDRLSRVCKEYGMEINVKKTKVMVVSRMD